MYSCILFDLDGTLTDSREGIVNSVRYALEKMNRPALTERELNQFVGPPLQQMFQQMCGFTPEEAIEGIARYRERYNTIGKFENAAAPGAAELLRELKERGYLVALASSRETRRGASSPAGISSAAGSPGSSTSSRSASSLWISWRYPV